MGGKRIGVKRVAGNIGAEIAGIDLARDLDEATVSELRRLWLEHLVLFFRNQSLDSAQFMAVAERFGPVSEYPFVKGLEDYPNITPVVKLEHERVNFGGVWHSDTTYLEIPPMATMLLARELPPAGGDTLFANQYLAYDTLSDGMKRLLSGLRGVSSSAKADVTRTREDRIADRGTSNAKRVFEQAHPAVRTHPETGRKALYVNTAHTLRFEDMSEVESAPILDYLFEHQIRPEFTCRFRWQVGSLALWDNRCAMHNPINDYHGFRRVMHRITLKGDRPV
jgi:taurine dioxygenase